MKLADIETKWSNQKTAELAGVLDQRGFERKAMHIADVKCWGAPYEDYYFSMDTPAAIEDAITELVERELRDFWDGADPYERCLMRREIYDVHISEIAYAYDNMYEYQMRNRIADNAPRAAEQMRRFGR